MKPSTIATDPLSSTTPLTTNRHLIRWVEKMADLCRPDSIHWVDGSQAEYDAICDRLVAAGTFVRLERRALARLLLCSLRPERRGPGGRSHLHLFALPRWRRPDQQLGRSVRHAPPPQAALSRMHARPHHVRAAVQHGSGRLAHVRHRRATD